MSSAVFVNAGAELDHARQVATNVIENRIYAERGLPASLEQANAWLGEAQAQAARLFQQPGPLAGLLADLAVYDPLLAHAIELTVQEQLIELRKTTQGAQTQTPEV